MAAFSDSDEGVCCVEFSRIGSSLGLLLSPDALVEDESDKLLVLLSSESRYGSDENVTGL